MDTDDNAFGIVSADSGFHLIRLIRMPPKGKLKTGNVGRMKLFPGDELFCYPGGHGRIAIFHPTFRYSDKRRRLSDRRVAFVKYPYRLFMGILPLTVMITGNHHINTWMT